VDNTFKFAAHFEVIDLKKITLINTVDLTIDYVATCTEIPIVLPHNVYALD
jgi:hypothetical protein